MNKKAVVLLSGGIDSTTCMAIAKQEGYELYVLTFDYKQRHLIEINAAKRIAAIFKVKKHLILSIPLRDIGGSALTDTIEVPKNQPLGTISDSIPVTYVPARNTIFLSFALAWAESLSITNIFIGVNAIDYSGYPDCRPEFIAAFENLATIATKIGIEDKRSIKIHTPLITLTKDQIIRKGIELGIDYSITHSCYDPGSDGHPCGMCDSCQLRKKGFETAGLKDPLINEF
ncbi:MAG: 7-cyano-7-deazaguanine synthase QueC [bacterium]